MLLCPRSATRHRYRLENMCFSIAAAKASRVGDSIQHFRRQFHHRRSISFCADVFYLYRRSSRAHSQYDASVHQQSTAFFSSGGSDWGGPRIAEKWPSRLFPCCKGRLRFGAWIFSGNLDASLFVEVDSQAHETCVLSI